MAEPEATFEFALAALGDNEGDVSLADFRKEVAAVEEALEAVDEDLHGHAQVSWIVKDLHHSQPTLELAGYPVGVDGMPGAAGRVLDTFFSGLAGLKRGSDTGELGHRALGAVRKLAEPVGQTLRRAAFKWEEQAIAVDVEFRAAFAKVQLISETRLEDWEGMLEELNVHPKEPTFRLYPVAGPRWITCQFDRRDLERVRAAITKKVHVEGRAVYRPRARFPHRIYLGTLDTIGGDPDELVKLSGSSPSDDHLDRLANMRHDWH